MEILQIARGRLKVTLSAEELLEYGIDPDKMNYDEAGQYKTFEGLLAVVAVKTELNLRQGKTYVQVYPSRDGGCELFFIHIDTEEQERKALVPVRDSTAYLCVFENEQQTGYFIGLLKARKRKGTAYFQAETGRYLVFVRCWGENELILEEFGKRVDPKTAFYLEEHLSAVTF